MRTILVSPFVAIAVVCAGIGTTCAQDEAGAVVEQRAIVVSANDSGQGAEIMAFEMSGAEGMPHVLNDMSFAMGMDNNQFSMLNNVSVQKDLQLVDDQIKEIKEINDDFGKKIREKIEEMKDENGNFNLNGGLDFGQMIRDLKQQQQDQVSSILLPNQQKRLEQVARQIRMKQMGTSKALNGKLAEELGITPEQKQKLTERSQELTKEIQEKIAELRKNAKQKLLAELTSDQRKKLEELLGDEYVEKKEDDKRRFRFNRGETRKDF